MVVLVQGDGADARLAVGFQGDEGNPLHGALPGDHHQELVFVKLPGDHHGGDGLAGIQGQHIDNGSAPGSAACLGNLVTLAVMHPSLIGEEEHVVVGRRNGQALDIILFLQVLGIDAPAATALGAVGVHGHSLDVALIGQREGAGLLLDQVFDVDLVLDFLNLGFPLVAELVPNFDHLAAKDSLEFVLVRQQLQIILDFFFQLVILALELFPVKTLEGFQTHVQNGLRLNVVQFEAIHQTLLGIVVSRADDVNDLVDVVLGNEQTFQQMCPLLRLFQVIPGAPGEDFFLMLQVLVDDLPQGENFRLLLVIHQRQHDNAEAGLQSRLLEQIVQHDLRIGVLFQLDDHTHTVAVGLIPEVGNAVQALVLHLLGNVLDELTLIDLIGKLGNDDPHPVFAMLLKFRPGADDHLATAGSIGRTDAAASHDDAAGREVRAGNMLHQVGQSRFRVVQHAHAGVDDLR